jgi:hypothetical protein
MGFDVASTTPREPAMSDQPAAHPVTARRMVIATAWTSAARVAPVGVVDSQT